MLHLPRCCLQIIMTLKIQISLVQHTQIVDIFFFLEFIYLFFLKSVRYLTIAFASAAGLQVYDVGISSWVDVSSVPGADAIIF